MTDTIEDPSGLNRRQFLKVGLFGTAVLATAGGIASLSGCSSDTSAQGYQQLRESDLPMLRRVIPVLLADAVSQTRQADTLSGVLQALDNNLNHLSPSLNRQVLQLFDLLTLGVTRGLLTGIWSSWEDASDDAIRAFIKRWDGSVLMLLRQGSSVLSNLTLLSYYATPASWAQCGYPGPPQLGTGATLHAVS